jgi:hypothetical protein
MRTGGGGSQGGAGDVIVWQTGTARGRQGAPALRQRRTPSRPRPAGAKFQKGVLVERLGEAATEVAASSIGDTPSTTRGGVLWPSPVNWCRVSSAVARSCRMRSPGQQRDVGQGALTGAPAPVDMVSRPRR